MEEMLQRGLYLSDYPLHDSARDLVMINNELKVEKEIALELEQTKQVLEVEKLKVLKEKHIGLTPSFKPCYLSKLQSSFNKVSPQLRWTTTKLPSSSVILEGSLRYATHASRFK